MGSLQSALLGYGVFKALESQGICRGFSAAENVIVQTTAVATATMPLAAGFVGILPALSLVRYTPRVKPQCLACTTKFNLTTKMMTWLPASSVAVHQITL